MPKPIESPEQIAQREYRQRHDNVSADRLIAYELYRLRLAIESASENSGKWLGTLNTTLDSGLTAIALAAPTPDDNSAEVRAITERIKKQVGILKSAEQQSKQ